MSLIKSADAMTGFLSDYVWVVVLCISQLLVILDIRTTVVGLPLVILGVGSDFFKGPPVHME